MQPRIRATYVHTSADGTCALTRTRARSHAASLHLGARAHACEHSRCTHSPSPSLTLLQTAMRMRARARANTHTHCDTHTHTHTHTHQADISCALLRERASAVTRSFAHSLACSLARSLARSRHSIFLAKIKLSLRCAKPRPASGFFAQISILRQVFAVVAGHIIVAYPMRHAGKTFILLLASGRIFFSGRLKAQP